MAVTRETSTGQRLRVRVNDELILDAGTCEEVSSSSGPEYLIHPPETSMFHQVLDYLRAKPDPPKRPSGSIVGREGVATTALVLRWGSYLATLLDRDKPVPPEIHAAGISRISDEEMARINIEASAALAEWIDIYRQNPGGRLFMQLVDRAVSYLPMPKKTSRLKVGEFRFAALADQEMAARVIQAASAERLARAQANAGSCPSRVFANALVNTAWRNGPVENIHAGRLPLFPLSQRRVTPTEERELMRFASNGMALGMTVCLLLARERSQRAWLEQVLPFGLAEILLITPSRWTLTEISREVRLPKDLPSDLG